MNFRGMYEIDFWVYEMVLVGEVYKISCRGEFYTPNNGFHTMGGKSLDFAIYFREICTKQETL